MSKYAEELLTVYLLVFILPYHTTVAFYLFLSYEVRADLFNPNYWQSALLTKSKKIDKTLLNLVDFWCE